MAKLNEYETLAERMAPGCITQASEQKTEEKVLKVEPVPEVIRLPLPSDADQALISIPLIRHWLFAPDRSRLRHREFRVQLEHRGKKILQKLSIGDRYAAKNEGYGVLKLRHQRLLFGLQQLWQKQGGRLADVNGFRRGVVTASSWELEEAVFGSHGGAQRRYLRAWMQQLSSIPVAIENHIAPNGSIQNIDVTGLISGAIFASRRDDGQIGLPWVETYLGPLVTEAFSASAIKPLNMRVLSELKTDLAALLYPKIDHFLASNAETELRLDGLVEKLGLSDKHLSRPLYRARKFEPAVKELDGVLLSKSGYVIKTQLVPTADKLDQKLVVSRRKI